MKSAAKNVQLGVIGGSGIYKMEGAKVVKEHVVQTPFGSPSDVIFESEIEGKTVYFIPRHGVGHLLLPSEVPYAANIYALKTLGVTHVLAVSAVGIMQENIKPGDMVVPNQIFDRTKGIRRSTFFGSGCAGHVEFADPFGEEMRQIILKAAKKAGANVHDGGAYICMEGPQFSTRAESNMYRDTIKPSVIGMTAIPEAKLAREAELCYGMLALATDYDCWKNDGADVSVEAVMAVLKENAAMANAIVKQVIASLPASSNCPTLSAAQYAIMTNREMIPAKTKENLQAILGQYF